MAELSVSWPGCTAGTELYEEVMQSLVDLAEVRPEAVQLMRGRTFARPTNVTLGQLFPEDVPSQNVRL